MTHADEYYISNMLRSTSLRQPMEQEFDNHWGRNSVVLNYAVRRMVCTGRMESAKTVYRKRRNSVFPNLTSPPEIICVS